MSLKTKGLKLGGVKGAHQNSKVATNPAAIANDFSKIRLNDGGI